MIHLEMIKYLITHLKPNPTKEDIKDGYKKFYIDMLYSSVCLTNQLDRAVIDKEYTQMTFPFLERKEIYGIYQNSLKRTREILYQNKNIASQIVVGEMELYIEKTEFIYLDWEAKRVEIIEGYLKDLKDGLTDTERKKFKEYVEKYKSKTYQKK